MLKGFKDFLMRGNVIDLAVAVIIGTAFTAVVTAIAANLIQPLIAAIGGANVGGLSWTIVAENEKSTIDFAAIITAVINFVIIAAIVYFLIVLPMKSIQERRKRGEEAGPAEPTDVELLIEIRDLLRQQQRPVGQGANPGNPYQGGPGQMPPGGPNNPGGPGPAGPPPGQRPW
ncbi:MAG: large-conductance mechanosensitive channel protein MscL [Actinophytocola sp.]|nr:large-conductance mechanosensitive channel protein MscL [Actinophytocola sp.]